MCKTNIKLNNEIEVVEYVNYQTGEKLDLDRVELLPDNAMLKVRPDLWCIWSFEKNSELDIWKMTKGTAKKVWWYCNDCKDSSFQSIESKTRGVKCSYCTGKKVNLKNCIKTTNPTVANMLLDENDAYKYTQFSDKRTDWKCLDCGEIIRNKQIKRVSTDGLNCPLCSKSFSYPERLGHAILREFGVKFEYEKAFKGFPSKRYDLYLTLDNEHYIIELNGAQHYTKGFTTLGGRTLQQEQENDKYKYNLAISNGIKKENYIIIDCRKSDFEFIKNNILNSRLAEIFDLSSVDWDKIKNNAEKSINKEILNLYNKTNDVKYICEYLNLSKNKVLSTLRRWNKMGNIELKYDNIEKKIVQLDINKKYIKTWNSVSEVKILFKNVNKVLSKTRESVKGFRFMYYEDYILFKDRLDEFPFYENKGIKKKVVQLSKNNEYIKVWDSIKDACDSAGLVSQSSISSVCKGKKNTAKGYKWMYLEDYEKMLKEQNQIS